MELKPVPINDVPCPALAGVTTVQLAKMVWRASEQTTPFEWDDLHAEQRKKYYRIAAALVMDWPKA